MTTLAIIFGAISVTLISLGIVQIIDDIVFEGDNLYWGGISFMIGSIGLFLCIVL